MSSPRDTEMDGSSEGVIPMEKESLPLGTGPGGGGEPSKPRKPNWLRMLLTLSKARKRKWREMPLEPSESRKCRRCNMLKHFSFSKQEKQKYPRRSMRYCNFAHCKGGGLKSCASKPLKTRKLKGLNSRKKANHASKATKQENKPKSSEPGEGEKPEDSDSDGRLSDEEMGSWSDADYKSWSDEDYKYEQQQIQDELDKHEGRLNALFVTFAMSFSEDEHIVDDIALKRLHEPPSPVPPPRPELFEADPEPFDYTSPEFLHSLLEVKDLVLGRAEQSDESSEGSDSEEQVSPDGVCVSGGGLEGEAQVTADAVCAAKDTGKLDEE